MKQVKNILSFIFIFSFSFLFANELHLSKIEDYIGKNKATKAYQYYQNIIKSDITLATTSEGLYLKARVYDALFREGKAVSDVELEKDALIAYVEVLEKGTEEYVTKSEIYLSKFEKCLHDKAREFSSLGNTTETLKLANVTASAHGIASNYLFLAKVEDYNRLFKKALTHYLMAINLELNQDEKVFERTLILMNEIGGTPSDKLLFINKGLEKYPMNQDLLNEKLQCYKILGEKDEEKVEDLFLAIANVDSQNQYVLYALGKLYYQQGLRGENKEMKWEQAKAYLELASKSQYITAAQKVEVSQYLEEIQSQL